VSCLWLNIRQGISIVIGALLFGTCFVATVLGVITGLITYGGKLN